MLLHLTSAPDPISAFVIPLHVQVVNLLSENEISKLKSSYFEYDVLLV